MLLIFTVLFLIIFFEIIFLLIEDIDFYSSTGYTIDSENQYKGDLRKRVHVHSDIPGLSYELNSGVNLDWQNIDININSFGIRDREFSKNKPENSYRIIALGDSVTFGQATLLNDTFLKILESKLNNNFDSEYEVMNAGVSAYNLVQKYIFLETKLIEYKPDMVLVNFVQDDYGPTNVLKYSKDGSEGSKPVTNKYELFSVNMPSVFPVSKKINMFLLRYSAFYRFINLRIYNMLSRIDPIKYPSEIYKLIGGNTNIDYNRDSIGKFHSLSQKHGFKLIIVSFPNLIKDSNVNDEWILTYPESEYNITTIDLYPLIDEKDVDWESIRLAPDDYSHLNNKGHAIIGDVLYNALIEIIEK